jgi:circadian clock protein KaiB
MSMTPENGRHRLLLFVVGDEVNSRQARMNLGRIVETHFPEPLEIQEVDVLRNFQDAIKYKVFITPALVIQGEASHITIYGNLGDEEKVLAALRGSVLTNA